MPNQSAAELREFQKNSREFNEARQGINADLGKTHREFDEGYYITAEFQKFRLEFDEVRHIAKCSSRNLFSKNGFSKIEEQQHLMSIASAFEDRSLGNL